MEEKKQNIITINSNEHVIKPGLKAMLIFEKEQKKLFGISTTEDLLKYVWSCLLAGTKDAKLEFNDMLDFFDNNPDLFEYVLGVVLPKKSLEKVVKLSNENDGGTEPKKD